MDVIKAKEIIRNAIYKVIPEEIKIDDEDNLLSYMGAYELVYVLTFIEEKVQKNFYKKLGRQPDNLTISGLSELLI